MQDLDKARRRTVGIASPYAAKLCLSMHFTINILLLIGHHCGLTLSSRVCLINDPFRFRSRESPLRNTLPTESRQNVSRYLYTLWRTVVLRILSIPPIQGPPSPPPSQNPPL